MTTQSKNIPVEQQLINELIRMIDKMGGKLVMKDLIEQVNTDGDPKSWTPGELESALDYVRWQNSYMSRTDALAIIEILKEKYRISKDVI